MRDKATGPQDQAVLLTSTPNSPSKPCSPHPDLAPASVARKASAMRQFYGFLIDEGWRQDDPSAALPRPRARRPLPRIIGHGEVEALFVQAETEAADIKTLNDSRFAAIDADLERVRQQQQRMEVKLDTILEDRRR